MSARPTAPNPALARLIDEGYEIEVREQHLLVHSVPYVTASREVKRATVACLFMENAGVLVTPNQNPDTHQIWFTGEFPCFATGARLVQLENENGDHERFRGFTVKHRFSNKPDGMPSFPDHYTKVVHYITLISDQARVIEPLADARTHRVIPTTPEESVFRYADSASARYGTLAVAEKLALRRIAIIGLGGTGSYVLDQVTKTPVCEIHLFDGDEFATHSAFRAPGAATIDELKARLLKTTYFARRYDHMHRGIHEHPYYITEANITELQGCDFVFVCVDRGPARKTITSYLTGEGIPFVDVGMAVELNAEALTLSGICRATRGTSAVNNHLAAYLPTSDAGADAIYRTNIQIADLNAMNAMLAVIMWKQHFGFYANDFDPHHLTFAVSSQSLTRDILRGSAQT